MENKREDSIMIRITEEQRARLHRMKGRVQVRTGKAVTNVQAMKHKGVAAERYNPYR